MSDEDRDPLLEVTTSRWHRKSSVICFLVFLVGLLSLVTALLVGYFGFVKSDAIGKSRSLTLPYIYALWDYGVCIPCKIMESKAEERTNVVQSKVGSFI